MDPSQQSQVDPMMLALLMSKMPRRIGFPPIPEIPMMPPAMPQGPPAGPDNSAANTNRKARQPGIEQ